MDVTIQWKKLSVCVEQAVAYGHTVFVTSHKTVIRWSVAGPNGEAHGEVPVSKKQARELAKQRSLRVAFALQQEEP